MNPTAAVCETCARRLGQCSVRAPVTYFDKGRHYNSETSERKDETWEGEVVVVETGKAIPFDSREWLATIIG